GKAGEALGAARPAKPAATLPPVAPPGAQAVPPPGARPDLLDRRAALADLATDYRRKLSELAKQQGAAGADPMERAAARREVRAWYIARRRAILRGQPLPDAGAP